MKNLDPLFVKAIREKIEKEKEKKILEKREEILGMIAEQLDVLTNGYQTPILVALEARNVLSYDDLWGFWSRSGAFAYHYDVDTNGDFVRYIAIFNRRTSTGFVHIDLLTDDGINAFHKLIKKF